MFLNKHHRQNYIFSYSSLRRTGTDGGTPGVEPVLRCSDPGGGISQGTQQYRGAVLEQRVIAVTALR